MALFASGLLRVDDYPEVAAQWLAEDMESENLRILEGAASNIVDLKGPESPDGLMERGPGLSTASMLHSDMELHPLEIQVTTADNEIIQRLPLRNLKGHGAPFGQRLTLKASRLRAEREQQRTATEDPRGPGLVL